jgi:MFS family permease
MDQNIYGFILPTLMALWHMSGTQAGSIMTIALLSSSIGGWIGGILADRLGRVRALQITVLWFALFSVVCALTSSYTELLIARGLFGIGFGAEWGIGVALIGEIASARHRGTAAGNVHSAWSVGWGLAGILYALYFAVLPETIAWRALFATGVVPALFIFWIRQYVEESPLYLKMRREAPAQSWTSFREIFSGNLLRPTILGAVLAMGIQGGGYTVATWLPAFLKTVRHLSILNTSGYLMLFIGATFVGYVGGAYLSDMIGRRRTFIFFAVFQGCVAFIYTYLPITDSMMLVMGIPLGLGFAGAYSGFGAQLNELFPTRVRGSGIGFTFNFGRACGSLFPFLVGAYSSSLGLGPSVALFTAAAYALAVIAALLLPETSGKELG